MIPAGRRLPRPWTEKIEMKKSLRYDGAEPSRQFHTRVWILSRINSCMGNQQAQYSVPKHGLEASTPDQINEHEKNCPKKGEHQSEYPPLHQQHQFHLTHYAQFRISETNCRVEKQEKAWWLTSSPTYISGQAGALHFPSEQNFRNLELLLSHL